MITTIRVLVADHAEDMLQVSGARDGGNDTQPYEPKKAATNGKSDPPTPIAFHGTTLLPTLPFCNGKNKGHVSSAFHLHEP